MNDFQQIRRSCTCSFTIFGSGPSLTPNIMGAQFACLYVANASLNAEEIARLRASRVVLVLSEPLLRPDGRATVLRRRERLHGADVDEVVTIWNGDIDATQRSLSEMNIDYRSLRLVSRRDMSKIQRLVCGPGAGLHVAWTTRTLPHPRSIVMSMRRALFDLQLPTVADPRFRPSTGINAALLALLDHRKAGPGRIAGVDVSTSSYRYDNLSPATSGRGHVDIDRTIIQRLANQAMLKEFEI